MSLSLADLKKSKQSRLDNAIAKSQKTYENSGSNKDERFWYPTVDKAGNGSAVIRLLPPSPQDGLESLPWTKYFEHSFKGPTGKWYIEKCLSSIGKPDPVTDYNSKLWATENETFKEQARKQKRKQYFVSNIMVVNDPANPENNGKVFLFRYGQKIFEKIKSVMTPDEQLGEEPNDPFDFWTGQNFKIKIKQVGGYRNYDDSSFSNPSAISKDDEEIDKIWNSQYSLAEFTDPSKYETYEVLEAKLAKVLDLNNEPLAKTAERASLQMDTDYHTDSDESDDYHSDSSDTDDDSDDDLDKILEGLK